jgi:YHS domain-containing protein
MIRTILLFILLVLVYQSLKVVLRSAIRASQEKDKRARIRGEEMVLDPECKTYVLKERAVARTVRGTKEYFCSEACAQKFEARNRN